MKITQRIIVLLSAIKIIISVTTQTIQLARLLYQEQTRDTVGPGHDGSFTEFFFIKQA